jgi:hypothetical protein
MDLKYIVYSTENNYVYTWTFDVKVANLLVSGDGDSMIRTLSWFNTPDFKGINNISADNTYLLDRVSNSITQISNDKVNDGWKKQKKLIIFRQLCFNYCIAQVYDSYARVTRNIWESFDVVASVELSKCKPTQHYYTPLIEEYAMTLGVSCEHAFKELKFVIESDNLTKFRIQALTEKWKNIINNTVDTESLEFIQQGILRDFWLNASI